MRRIVIKETNEYGSSLCTVGALKRLYSRGKTLHAPKHAPLYCWHLTHLDTIIEGLTYGDRGLHRYFLCEADGWSGVQSGLENIWKYRDTDDILRLRENFRPISDITIFYATTLKVVEEISFLHEIRELYAQYKSLTRAKKSITIEKLLKRRIK